MKTITAGLALSLNGRRLLLAALFAAQSAGCGGEDKLATPKEPKVVASAPSTAPKPQPSASAAPDAFGDRPGLGGPRSFEPPSPSIAKTKNGMALWIMERPALPLVSVTLTVPTGSASDPADKPGLAHITADMLDEGAGRRSAVEVSSAINDLGATLSISVAADGTSMTLTVLKKNFAKAFSIFSDIVARPRFDDKEWKRVSDLWKNDLEKRADEPSAVSRIVTMAAHFGPNDPYGHPTDGLLRGAKAIELAAVKDFYKSNFSPERSTLVIVGDITKEEAVKATAGAFDSWRPTRAAGAPPKGPESPAPPWKAPRLVLVDRPDAPQSVIAVVREGVAASDPKAPLLDLINTAFGGTFTSRFNQNLREDHGYSYGARSAFTESKRPGVFLARAAVHTEATGPALKETLNELTKMAEGGPTEGEFVKILAQDRGEIVQAYESVSSISSRLGRLAMLGLPSTFDAEASRARQKATLASLKSLSSAVDPKTATIVVVGPRKHISPALAALGLGEPELWDADGNPIVSSAAAPAPQTPQ